MTHPSKEKSIVATTMIRVRKDIHALLRELSADEGESMQTILARALDEYRRARFIEKTNAGYAELRADPEAWKQEMEERSAWGQ